QDAKYSDKWVKNVFTQFQRWKLKSVQNINTHLNKKLKTYHGARPRNPTDNYFVNMDNQR
ncbi:6360_t:CDS:2, partial [Diversispora eburnea]